MNAIALSARVVVLLCSLVTFGVASAGVIGPDDRGSLLKHGPGLGLTKKHINQLLKATGQIRCPDANPNNQRIASATIVGDGRQLLTVAHAFIDGSGKSFQSLKDCTFTNHAKVPVTAKLDFSHAIFATKHRFNEGNFYLDRALVLLKKTYPWS